MTKQGHLSASDKVRCWDSGGVYRRCAKNLNFKSIKNIQLELESDAHQTHLLPETDLNHLPQSERSLARSQTRLRLPRPRQTTPLRTRTRQTHRHSRLQTFPQHAQRSL